jgi:ABC-2 type transport system ATP-binding protein
MITLTNLSKRFDRQLVINDINVKIEEGEIVGLLGPNGAGKTTTLRMIAGVLPSSKGSVQIDDSNIAEDNTLKKRIGFLPENNPLYAELTVEEFLSFWADMKEISKSDQQDAIDFVVDRCGIGEVYYRPIGELSKGYRQRVGLSQAILTKPDILILDEPTEGLDPNQRQEIATLIRDLGKKRTVIISSHVLAELAKITTRMIIIHKGGVVADETPENLKRLGSSSQVVEIEVKGRNVMSTLKKVDGVKAVIEKKKNYFVIEVEGKNDVREELFKLAVKNKWVLRTLLAKEIAIEDVFSQLTNN